MRTMKLKIIFNIILIITVAMKFFFMKLNYKKEVDKINKKITYFYILV